MADIDLTSHWVGLASLVIFVLAYLMVIFEEVTKMRKSKPVMVAAGLIWELIGLAYAQAGLGEDAHAQAMCYNRNDWGQGLKAVAEKRHADFDSYHSK